VVARLDAELDIDIVTIDESEGRTLSHSIALVANARMHIGIDSFCNHLTNYYWTDRRGGRKVPGVILWGSTQASAAGYPDNINLSAGLACQPCFRENPAISRMPRGPCINPPRPSYEDGTPHACMQAITLHRVVDAVRDMWERAG
jgi:ADP-heptose:LPS heptosyltransferase